MRVIGIQTIGSLDQNDSDGSKELSLKKRHGRTDEGRREGGKDNMARRSHRHAGLADRWILADKFLTYHLHFFCSCRHFQGCPLELPSCCWSRPPPWAPAEISQLVLVRVVGLPGAPADPGCCPPWGAGFQLQLILVAGPLWGVGQLLVVVAPPPLADDLPDDSSDDSSDNSSDEFSDDLLGIFSSDDFSDDFLRRFFIHVNLHISHV